MANIHIDNLRSSNPTTLEIEVQGAIRKPISQLSPTTLADLFALAEVESLPKSLRRDFEAFYKRASQEIADYPDGAVFRDFLDGLADVQADKIASNLRELVARESKRETREPRGREKAADLLGAWEEVEPETVEIAQGAPRIVQATAGRPESVPLKGKAIGKVSDTPRAASPRPVIIEDPERAKWLHDAILRRLANTGEKGLSQIVLIAGLRHEAKDVYPDLVPYEITKALKLVSDKGTIRHSAGRWMMMGRLW